MNSPPETCRRMRIALGTTVVIEASTQTAGAALAVASAFGEIARLEGLLHPRRPGSDLARINGAAAGSRTAVQSETLQVLELAKRIWQSSLGVFDPCTPAARGRLDDVELTVEGSVCCRAPVAIDLGGIAKGFAVDLAIHSLQDAGCVSGLVNAGGDVRAFGPEAQEIILRRGGAAHAVVSLRDAALAVTDIDLPARERPPEHQGYYLRLDAAASAGLRIHRRFAAVVAPGAAIADALAKCVCLCPPDVASHVLEQFGARLGPPRRT